MTTSSSPVSSADAVTALARFGETPPLARKRLDHELERFQSELARHGADWDTPLPGRPWSAAQLAEHVTLINLGIARILTLLASDQDLSQVPSRPGTLKDGKFQSPEHGLPGEGWPAEELARRWAEAHTRLQNAAQLTEQTEPGRAFAHPFFGPLGALDWVRMAALHTAHHRKQLEGVPR